MAVMHTVYCKTCDRVQRDVWSDDIPACCGTEMSIAIVSVNTPEWGSPRHIPTLRDEPFESRDELKRFTEQRGLSLGTAAEKVGGARNEDHLNLGKKFSYSGAPGS